MPGLTRRFSDSASDADTVAAVNGFPNSRVSLSVNQHNVHGQTQLPLLHRPKRRKTVGLNARFDDMIRKVSLLDSSSSTSSSSWRNRQRASSGSSSTLGSTSDIPSTPLDAYTDLNDGRLGRGFSLIKMATSAGRPQEAHELVSQQCGLNEVGLGSATHTEPPPSWLCATISTLGQDHPLRLIVPQSDAHICGKPPTQVPQTTTDFQIRPSGQQDEDPVFAFAPPGDVDFRPVETLVADETRQPGNQPADGSSKFAPAVVIERRSPQFLSDIADVEQTDVLALSYTAHTLSPYTPDLGTDFHSPGSDDFRTASIHARNYAERASAGPDTSISFEEAPFSMPGPLATESPLAAKFSRARFSVGPDLYTIDANAANLSPARHSRLTSIALPQKKTEEYTSYHYPKTLESLLSVNNDAHIDTDAFSTPGPTYTSPPGVYFDSPAEDPMHSDPIDPADYQLDLDVDYEKLDFRWEPFFRNRSASSAPVEPEEERLSDQDLAHDVPPDFSPFPDGEPDVLLTEEGLPVHDEDYEDIALDPDVVESEIEGVHDRPEALPRTPEPEKKVFAPAPDIFISPLRGDNGSTDTTERERPRNLKDVLDALDFGQQFMPSATSTPPHAVSGQSKASFDRPTRSEDVPAVEDIEAPEVEEHDAGPGFSQVSNDSIESWTSVQEQKHV